MSRGHAIVVGSSSGLGRAVAARLRSAGHVVSGLSRRASAADAVDSSHPCDVTEPTSLRTAIAAAVAAHGPPEVLVYAAGMPAMGRTLAVPEAEARRCFEVNFWGLDRAVREVLPLMSERRRGAIIGLSSIAALRAVPYEAFYAASKAAAARYLGCLAHEGTKIGVRVHYLNIGYIDTGFAEKGGWFGMPTPSGRGSGLRPEDVAEAVLDLLSGHRISDTIGWKERAIALADRLVPELYDRLLRWREGRETK
ncbi:MAG: SDR family oxidoreductase [Myxococcota bacterium]|nr:SDR family oxidoreductase [Myxococcota bacterium]